MNNFKLALGQSWNKYYALNEFLGSGLLTLLIIVFFYIIKKNTKNKFVIAPVIGVIFLVVTMITTVSGHFYGGSSNALALINPLNVIMNGVIRNTYIGMAYIIGFEFLGTMCGGIMAICVIKGLGGSLREFAHGIIFDNSSWYQSLTKEAFMNIFLGLGVISVPLFAWIHSTSDGTLSYVVLASLITILLLATSDMGYFMFMLPLSIFLLIIKALFDVVEKSELINFTITTGIHIIIPFIIGGVLYQFINSGKIYFHLS